MAKFPETIPIKISHYSEESPELLAEVERLGLQRFDVMDIQPNIAGKRPPKGVYNVETKFLFSNQYNTAEGFRIFEVSTLLHRGARSNWDKRGEGYYISEGIEAIRACQDRVEVCGYCGKQYIDSVATVCRACLGSAHLKETDLHLLQLLPVRTPYRVERKLTPEVLATLLPQWKTAQGLGEITRAEEKKSRNRQKVDNLIPEAEKKASDLIACATIETNGLTWLLDHEINILDNVIYYNHSKQFSFGWIKPLTEDERATLGARLTDFPYPWEFHLHSKGVPVRG